jgi:hypothetical protein
MDGPSDDAQLVDRTPQPTVVVSNVAMPREVALDATNLYFAALDDSTESDAIYQVAKGTWGRPR